MIATLTLVVALVTPSCWQPPVDAPVVRPFVAPACTWCPGHRGLEFRPRPGAPVRAPAAGVVVFAGPVVGVNYLVIRVVDGRRITLGMVAAIRVRAGEPVEAGQIVARSAARLLLSVRVGNRYLDPAPLLGRPRRHPRLVPLDGNGSRPAGSPSRACATADPGR